MIKAVIKDTFFPHLNEPMQSGDGFGNESDAAGHRHLLETVERLIHTSMHTPFTAHAMDLHAPFTRIHAPVCRHLLKVVEWFHASLMRRSPWSTWTNDIYDAMRCIDHLPIS